MKFHKKRLKFVIPLTVIVTVASTFMLFNRYPEVASKDKFLILTAATIFTAIISYLLFPQEGDNPDDVGPYK